jgi:Recombination endonuclease VII
MVQRTHCKSGHEYTEGNTRVYKNIRLCRKCVVIRAIKYRHAHPEKSKLMDRNSTKRRQADLKRKSKRKLVDRRSSLKRIGWTPEMLAQTIVEQGNVCASCREPFTKKDPPHADHKHVEPSEPRGVLHASCNRAIGILKENPARIRAAADYVESWS